MNEQEVPVHEVFHPPTNPTQDDMLDALIELCEEWGIYPPKENRAMNDQQVSSGDLFVCPKCGDEATRHDLLTRGGYTPCQGCGQSEYLDYVLKRKGNDR